MTLTALFPLMMTDCPAPSIVNGPPAAFMKGSVDESVIVPLTAKSIASASGLALAKSIASRRDPAPLSAKLVTVNVAAFELDADPSVNTSPKTKLVNPDFEIVDLKTLMISPILNETITRSFGASWMMADREKKWGVNIHAEILVKQSK
jgi:hypothetical protein